LSDSSDTYSFIDQNYEKEREEYQPNVKIVEDSTKMDKSPLRQLLHTNDEILEDDEENNESEEHKTAESSLI